MAPQGFLASMVQVKSSFLQQQRGCGKRRTLKKKTIIPVKKIFWPLLSRFIDYATPQGTTYSSAQGSLKTNVKL